MGIPFYLIVCLLVLLAIIGFWMAMQVGVEGGTWSSGILNVFKTIYKPVA